MQVIKACREEGIILAICQTWRSFEEQDLLYQKGRTRPGPKVTNARPGNSYHNFGRACDCAFMVDGKLVWDGPWERYGEIAKQSGLAWGGDFKSFPDKPHIENQDIGLSKLLATYPNGWNPYTRIP